MTIATLVALLLASVALTVYILPANYGLDPTGVGSTFGFQGQPPGAEEAPAGPEAPNVTLEEAPLNAYDVGWSPRADAGPGTGGYTAENETTTVALPLPPANLTEVRLSLTWTDDNETAGQPTEPDRLELVLEAPNGTRTEPVQAENEPDGEGQLATAFAVQPVPANRTVHAQSPVQARAHPTANVTDATPTGNWTAHVTVHEAGDAAMDDMDAGGDEGTDWQLDTTVETYQRSLAERGPADVREDVQTFELAPGEGMEHKVTLTANTTLAYAWRASGEVYYDFHAEPANASGFTSFGTATADESTGTHVAPFGGTHGWYWENRGDQPVAITLATRGDYTEGFTR